MSHTGAPDWAQCSLGTVDCQWKKFQVIVRERKKDRKETSLVVQWLRIRLPMQGTQVESLVWEDSTCHRATKPVCHDYRACAPQQEKMLLSCVQLCVTHCTEACQAPPSMKFSRQKYWSGLPCPPPGELPDPGIEPGSPALAGGFFTG